MRARGQKSATRRPVWSCATQLDCGALLLFSANGRKSVTCSRAPPPHIIQLGRWSGRAAFGCVTAGALRNLSGRVSERERENERFKLKGEENNKNKNKTNVLARARTHTHDKTTPPTTVERQKSIFACPTSSDSGLAKVNKLIEPVTSPL